MVIWNLNDYELIDLIKEGNEVALNIMFEKYKFLIIKLIAKYNLTDEYDDMFQEGQIMLYHALKKFDDKFNKSFTRYFELSLENKFKTFAKRKKKQPKLIEETMLNVYEAEPMYDYTEAKLKLFRKFELLTDFEREVFRERIINNKSVSETALILKISEKQVYNTMYRVKNKIKSLDS